jgi:hypothetical protein
MAEPSVKDEPNPMSRAFCNPFAPATPISDSHSTDNTEPLWKQCDSRDRVDQVKINEEAAAHSQKFFENIEKVLNDFREQVTSCDTRLKEIGKHF